MTTRGSSVFSGEPLPIAPKVTNAELEAFHRKLLDYLRRLAAKLGRFIDQPNEGIVKSLAATKDADQGLTGGSTYDAITWETELWSDTQYTLSGTTVTINEGGRYVVHLDVAFFKPLDIKAHVLVNSVEVAYSLIYSYNGTASGYSMSGTIPLELTAGDVIVCEVAASAADTILADGTRLTILKVDGEEA